MNCPAYFDWFVNFVVDEEIKLLKHHVPLHH